MLEARDGDGDADVANVDRERGRVTKSTAKFNVGSMLIPIGATIVCGTVAEVLKTNGEYNLLE